MFQGREEDEKNENENCQGTIQEEIEVAEEKEEQEIESNYSPFAIISENSLLFCRCYPLISSLQCLHRFFHAIIQTASQHSPCEWFYYYTEPSPVPVLLSHCTHHRRSKLWLWDWTEEEEEVEKVALALAAMLLLLLMTIKRYKLIGTQLKPEWNGLLLGSLCSSSYPSFPNAIIAINEYK